MRVEIPRTHSKVGLFTTVDNTLSFLSLVFLFVLFPNLLWCSFILVIFPLFPSAHSSMPRAVVRVEAVTTPFPFPPPLHRSMVSCALAIYPQVMVSSLRQFLVMFARIPRFFHATMLPSTPWFQPRQRYHIHHGNFRTRILFCSGNRN